jgi:hypothetical protein
LRRFRPEAPHEAYLLAREKNIADALADMHTGLPEMT